MRKVFLLLGVSISVVVFATVGIQYELYLERRDLLKIEFLGNIF